MQVFKKWRSPPYIQIGWSPGHIARWKTNGAKHRSLRRSRILDVGFGQVTCYSHWNHVMPDWACWEAWISTSSPAPALQHKNSVSQTAVAPLVLVSEDNLGSLPAGGPGAGLQLGQSSLYTEWGREGSVLWKSLKFMACLYLHNNLVKI